MKATVGILSPSIEVLRARARTLATISYGAGILALLAIVIGVGGRGREGSNVELVFLLIGGVAAAVGIAAAVAMFTLNSLADAVDAAAVAEAMTDD